MSLRPTSGNPLIRARSMQTRHRPRPSFWGGWLLRKGRRRKPAPRASRFTVISATIVRPMSTPTVLTPCRGPKSGWTSIVRPSRDRHRARTGRCHWRGARPLQRFRCGNGQSQHARQWRRKSRRAHDGAETSRCRRAARRSPTATARTRRMPGSDYYCRAAEPQPIPTTCACAVQRRSLPDR